MKRIVLMTMVAIVGLTLAGCAGGAGSPRDAEQRKLDRCCSA